MNILVFFMRAHLGAQKEFCRYFVGLDDKGTPVTKCTEIARCLIQSQVFIYRAANMADIQLQDLDIDMLNEVHYFRESKVVVEELESFVLRAFHKGVISGREAESILKPLHRHIKECMAVMKQSSKGVKLSVITNAAGGPKATRSITSDTFEGTSSLTSNLFTGAELTGIVPSGGSADAACLPSDDLTIADIEDVEDAVLPQSFGKAGSLETPAEALFRSTGSVEVQCASSSSLDGWALGEGAGGANLSASSEVAQPVHILARGGSSASDGSNRHVKF